MPKQSNRHRMTYVWLRKQLFPLYGAIASKKLAQTLIKAEVKTRDHCVDNYRWCELTKPAEVAAYDRARANGCCGFHDEEVLVPGAFGLRRFRVGFNYGH